MMIKSKNRGLGILQHRAKDAVVIEFGGKFSDGLALVIRAGDRSPQEKARVASCAAGPCAPGAVSHGNRRNILPINSSLFHAEANGNARNAVSTARAGKF